MKSDFAPLVEIGGLYKTVVGDFIKVVYFLDAEPGLEETVGYVYMSDPAVEKEATLEQWNSFNLEKVNSTPLPEPEPKNDDPQPKEPTKSDEPSKPSSQNFNTEPEHVDSVEEKIRKLEALLNAGPIGLNQDYIPTDKNLSENNFVEDDAEKAFQKTLDSIAELREKGSQRKASKINEFLWNCGGLDINLLRMCPTDWAKKAGMGGTILATSVLAVLSMTFAAYTVASIGNNGGFGVFFIAILLGIIWGLVIFNLDRYLVNSMFSDGMATISWPEFKSGLPRIIIAIFLGIVISTPLEMKIFDGKINEYIVEMDEGKTSDDALRNSSPKLRELYAQLEAQRSITAQKEKIWQKADSLYQVELTQGQYGSIAGYGPKAKKLEESKNNAYGIYKDSQTRLDTLQQQYDREHNVTLSNKSENISLMQGFSRKIEALLEITSFHKYLDSNGKRVYKNISKDKANTELVEEFNSLWMVRLLIMFMFIVLEVLPVFNKMMQQDGQYDKLIDLESDTTDKLTRIKEFNNINVVRSGHLAMYSDAIIGREISKDENVNLEGTNPFYKRDRKKENKEHTEEDNQEIYNEARLAVKNAVIAEIHRIFNVTVPVNATPASSSDSSNDPSKEAVDIA